MNPQESLNKVLEAFESGKLPEIVKRTWIEPSGNIPSEKWSLMNRILMTIHGTSDARGFKQWKTVGRYVKKGSHAFAILAPTFRIVEQENNKGEKEKIKILSGFMGVPVFRYEDTAGDELPEDQRAEPQPENLPPLMDVAQEFGLNVQYSACRGGFLGYYQNDTKQIVLCSHDQEVFFHELGHAAHYRSKGEHAKATNGQDWRKETVAELVAASISQIYGHKTQGNAYQYIRSYAEKAKKDVMKACMAVLSDTQKALNEIFNTKNAIAQAA